MPWEVAGEAEARHLVSWDYDLDLSWTNGSVRKSHGTPYQGWGQERGRVWAGAPPPALPASPRTPPAWPAARPASAGPGGGAGSWSPGPPPPPASRSPGQGTSTPGHQHHQHHFIPKNLSIYFYSPEPCHPGRSVRGPRSDV